MQPKNQPTPETRQATPAPAPEVPVRFQQIAGALLFSLAGLVWAVLEFLPAGAGPWIYGLLQLFLLAGAVLGWVQRFPAWVFAYIGLLLPFTAWLSSLSFAGRPIGGWAWLPLLVGLLVAALLTRSLRPILGFLRGIWHDGTRLSYTFYGAMPLLVLFAFDEVSAPYPVPYQLGASIFLAAGAWIYLGSTSTARRLLALFAGLTLAWVVTTAGEAAYWDGLQKPWMDQPGSWAAEVQSMSIAWILLVVLIFGLPLLLLYRRTQIYR